MHATILELPALRLMTVKAVKFPEGTTAAFSAIESPLATLRGRRMYGLVFSTAHGIEYHAGLVPESDLEERRLGLTIIEIPAGLCARTKLIDWAAHTAQIGTLVGKMIERFGIDPSRPTMEYYRSQRELQLFVPIARRPANGSDKR